jgi:hypothetical protein
MLDDLSLTLGPVQKRARTGIAAGGGGGATAATSGSGVAGAKGSGAAGGGAVGGGAGQRPGDGGAAAERGGGGAQGQAWDGSGRLVRSSFSLDKLQDYKISWKIHLFPGGFSIEGQNEAHQYDKSVKEFLTSIDAGLLPADVTMDAPMNTSCAFDYYDGCLLAEVRDHRLVNQIDLKPRVYRVLLQPDNVTLTNDLRYLWRGAPELSQGDVLLLEKSMLCFLQPALCLDPHPKVGMVAASLQRRAQRCQVWHRRGPRPLTSEHRRKFEAEPLRRMNAAARTYRNDPNAQSKVARLEKLHKARAWRAQQGSIKNTLLQQQQMEWEEEERAERGIQAIVRLGPPVLASPTFNSPLPTTPTPVSTGKGKAKNTAAANAGGYVPMSPSLLRMTPAPLQVLKGQVPERSMKFRKDVTGPGGKHIPNANNQVVSVWVHADTKAKVGSAYNLYIKLEEETYDNKPVDGSQSQLPPMPIGNSQKALQYGAQQLELMQRDGWQPIFDSFSKTLLDAHPQARGGQGGSTSRSTVGGGGAAKGGANKGGIQPGAAAGRGASPGGMQQQYGKPGMAPAGGSTAARPATQPPSGAMRPGMAPAQAARPGQPVPAGRGGQTMITSPHAAMARPGAASAPANVGRGAAATPPGAAAGRGMSPGGPVAGRGAAPPPGVAGRGSQVAYVQGAAGRGGAAISPNLAPGAAGRGGVLASSPAQGQPAPAGRGVPGGAPMHGVPGGAPMQGVPGGAPMQGQAGRGMVPQTAGAAGRGAPPGAPATAGPGVPGRGQVAAPGAPGSTLGAVGPGMVAAGLGVQGQAAPGMVSVVFRVGNVGLRV